MQSYTFVPGKTERHGGKCYICTRQDVPRPFPYKLDMVLGFRSICRNTNQYTPMRKLFAFFAMVCCIVLQAAPTEENVTLKVNDSVQIQGTLLLPEGVNGAVPLVIIVAGSGPTDRNGNNPQMENNSLRMTADSLAAAGIASLRYDKRGIAASRIENLKEEELIFDDYVDDLNGWVDMYAGDRRFSKIVVLGHSEGSLIGLAAAQNNPRIEGFISVAGSGRSMDKLLKEQIGRQSSQALTFINPIVDSLKAGKTVESVMAPFNVLFRPSVQPFLISCFRHDPAVLISRVECPVLIVQGDKDIQVTVADADSLSAANPSARKAVIAGMNHVLKTTDTMDMQAQVIKTYMDPTLPLNKEFARIIIAFVKDIQ